MVEAIKKSFDLLKIAEEASFDQILEGEPVMFSGKIRKYNKYGIR